MGIMDRPSKEGRKRHKRATPLAGGTLILISTLVGYIPVAFFAPEAITAPLVGAFLFATLLLYATGLCDDRYDISPTRRLLFVSLVFLFTISTHKVLLLSSIDAGFFGIIPLGAAATPFTLLCLLGLLNATNMADGKNGVVITLSLIWSVVLAVHAPIVWVPVLGAFAAALLVALYFNMRERLFLGDNGSYVLASFIGLLTIVIYNVSPSLTAVYALVMFGIPVLEVPRLIILRLKKGVSPFHGDRNHLHHLLWMRWGWPKGLFVYTALVGIPNLVALAGGIWTFVALIGMFAAYGRLISTLSASAAAQSDAGAASSSRVLRIDRNKKVNRRHAA